MPQAADAQNRFTPRVQVGEQVITQYQLDQRTRFLSLLRAPGDPRALAREQLINEAVQIQTAQSLGVAVSDAEVESGQGEFAGRANLTRDQFLGALSQNGVQAETFRDFVRAGVLWRNVVRSRFGEQARDIPGDQIERTLALQGTEGGLRVLISEILLPATTPETALASRQRASQLTALADENAFAAAARQFSVAPSKVRGGALNWTSLEALPDEVRPAISALTPGQTTAPIELENAIGLFFLRDIERVAAGQPGSLSVDYALFVTDGGPAKAAAILRDIDVCDDLYGVAKGLPEDRLVREFQPETSLPADVRAELANLDVGEGSTRLTRGGNASVLMLCSRQPSLESSVDFDIVANRLTNSRLGAFAANYLAEQRARMFIADVAN